MRTHRLATVAASLAVGLAAVALPAETAGASQPVRRQGLAGAVAPERLSTVPPDGLTLTAPGEASGVVTVPASGGTVTPIIGGLPRQPDWCSWHDSAGWGLEQAACVDGEGLEIPVSGGMGSQTVTVDAGGPRGGVETATITITEPALADPAGPPTVDLVPPGTVLGTWGNLHLGDCVMAGVANFEQILGSPQADPSDPAPWEATFYALEAQQGLAPDTGLWPAPTLQTWETSGLVGTTIASATPLLDPASPTAIKTAVHPGGTPLYATIVVPTTGAGASIESTLTPWPVSSTGWSQQIWSTSTLAAAEGLAGGGSDGHVVLVVGWDPTGPILATWGAQLQASWAFWATVVQQVWVIQP